MSSLQNRLQAANSLLSPCAVPHGTGLGRASEEPEDETRFPFQRDRDRIIHCDAFRRLKGKTQVFVAHHGDHYRTRLTHTMEVAQISRDMARTLALNEDLAECIALAHDLGHTPFGHAGEDVMHEMMQLHGFTFEHNLQSLRIVTLLEQRSKLYPGLNVNREILEGLMKHRTAFDVAHDAAMTRSPSLEAQIVNLADEIAYTAHDVEDGLRSGILTQEELSAIPLFDHAYRRSRERGTDVRGSIIHLLVMDAYAASEHQLHDEKIQALSTVYTASEELIVFSDDMRSMLDTLREYLYEHFYRSDAVLAYSEKGQHIIRTLFEHYEKHSPEKILELQRRTGSTLPEAIKDYIAGMTDAFAEKCKQDLTQ